MSFAGAVIACASIRYYGNRIKSIQYEIEKNIINEKWTDKKNEQHHQQQQQQSIKSTTKNLLEPALNGEEK